MTAVTCPHGQTYGTCRKHKEPAPEVCSFLFIRSDGMEWHTFIVRPKWQTDEQWAEAMLWSANNVARQLVDVAERNPVA